MKLHAVALSLLIVMSISTVVNAQEPSNQRRLGILGGLAGAAIGAAAGEDDGDAVPGALIGGTIGLITGAAAGNAMDQTQYHRQQQQAAFAQQQARAVTMSDVVSMTHAGLGDAVIVNHIRTHGMVHHVSASDLIVLKQQGVSDVVLSAMQGAPAARPVTVVREPAPVIVEEHYYTRPSPVWWHHHHYHSRHRHYHRPRSHTGIHFSFGN